MKTVEKTMAEAAVAATPPTALAQLLAVVASAPQIPQLAVVASAPQIPQLTVVVSAAQVLAME